MFRRDNIRATTPIVTTREIQPGLRELLIRLLRRLKLNRVAARFYYRWLHGFSSAGKDLPAAIERSFSHLASSDSMVTGDYYEFGVFKGYSLLCAYQAARSRKFDDMRFFGFDSFAGIPPVKGPDQVENAPFYEGQFAWPLARVIRDLDRRGVDWDKVMLVEGYFDDTLIGATRKKFGMRKAAVVLIDCDLYNSSARALDFLRDLFYDGTILIMDDWNAFAGDDARGERLALRKFLHANPEWHAEPWFSYGIYGQVFVMRHRPGQKT